MQSHYNREAKRGQHLLGELLTLGLVYAGKTSYNKDKLEGGSSMRIPPALLAKFGLAFDRGCAGFNHDRHGGDLLRFPFPAGGFGPQPLPLCVSAAFGLGHGGVAVAILIISIDYRAWIRWTRIIYLGNILLLAGVLLMGKTAFGSQRWVKLGPLNIQPSELAKIGLILVLAKIFFRKKNRRVILGR